ncbi:MAG: hypothetical protein J2P46_08970, partial [Zavarzinella sp.]|nr:hypothetical protein [Zavarzinella sp.]
MTRLTISVLLFAAGVAGAQDIPLYEILKPGETWQPYSDGMPARPTGDYSVDPKTHTITTDRGPDDRLKLPLKEPTACAVVHKRSTLLVADAGDRYVWAFRIENDGTIGPGDRYVRLRVAGDDRRRTVTPPEAYRADPSAMTMDAADRTYVATSLGIQVFDPTGRLCGVFTAPPGRVGELAFVNDRLFARVGDKVFVRKM